MVRMVMIIPIVVIQMTTPMTVAHVEDGDERRINIAVGDDTALITLTTATAVASIEGEEDAIVVMTVMKVLMIVVLMLNQNAVKKEEEGEGGTEVQVTPTLKDQVKMRSDLMARRKRRRRKRVVMVKTVIVILKKKVPTERRRRRKRRAKVAMDPITEPVKVKMTAPVKRR